MAEPRIALEPRHFEQLIGIIRRSMSNAHGAVLLFGSRARGNPRPASDIDLAVSVKGSSAGVLSSLRENLENSLIPFTVDVVDLDSCDPVLAGEVQREGVVLWNG